MRRSRLQALALEDRVTPVVLPEGFSFSQVTGSLDSPTAFVPLPDGRILVTEQAGDLRMIEADGELIASPVLELAVDHVIERGLLGIALDPGFDVNHHFYLYYTVPGSNDAPVHNRVSRFTLTDETIDPTSELVLVDLDPLGHGAHNGGALRFGLDGKLYVAVGDNVVPANAQLTTNYFGKILRFNTDGTIPEDNPAMIAGIANPPIGKYRAIYAAGFRNPYTFDVDPVTGTIHVNDVGQDAKEEVNLLGAGLNYGWSVTEGTFDAAQFPDFTQPIISYSHIYMQNDAGYAVTGGTFYRPDVQTFPEEFVGDYFFADLVNGWIRVYDSATGSNSLFASDLMNLSMLGLDTAPDGSLLVLSFNEGTYYDGTSGTGGVYRIRYSEEPSIQSQPRSATRLEGQAVTFAVEASSALPLTYQWQRDQVDIPGATDSSYTIESVQLDDDGSRYRVIVGNATQSVASAAAVLTVTDDLPPLVSISWPLKNTTFEYGQTVDFSGIAFDNEDGELLPGSLSWRVDYITGNALPRPFYPETKGIAGGSVTLPTSSPYTRTDVLFRFVLTAKDSHGNTVAAIREITPVLGSARLESDAPGVSLQIDGTPHLAPYTFDGVVGLERTLSAPASATIGSKTYSFRGWSDGKAELSRTISVANGGIAFKAIYLTAEEAADLTPIVVGGETTQSVRKINAVTGEGVATIDLTKLNLPAGFQMNETRVARGDVDGDGIDDLIVGTGPGAEPNVLILHGETIEVLASFRAFESTFTGGVFVAAGDLDGDGRAEVIVTPDRGGGPRVRIYRNGDPQTTYADFFGIEDPDFRGGSRASLGDVNGDGRADLVVAAGFEGGPRIAVYDGTTVSTNVPRRLFNDFFAFEESLRNGVYLAVGDLDGDGKADLVAGGGPGGAPRVTVFSAADLLSSDKLVPLANFYAGDESQRNGVRLGITDADRDSLADLVVGSAPGAKGEVVVYRGADLASKATPEPFLTLAAFEDDYAGGVFVG